MGKTTEQSIRDVLDSLIDNYVERDGSFGLSQLTTNKHWVEVRESATQELLNIIEGLLPEEHVCTDICNISCKEWKIGHKAYKDAEHNIISEIRERLNK